jgi:hypothetical protein
MLLIYGIFRISAHLRLIWPSITLRSKFCVYIISIILVSSAIWGVMVISNDTRHSSFVVPVNSGPNLLLNPSFETGIAGLANNWHREYDSAAIFSLVNIGVIEGKYAQHISKTGTNKDNNGLLEIYQWVVSNNTYGSGDILVFSVYISGSINKCSGIIGIEGFENWEYIDEEDVYLSGITKTPQLFGVSYQIPANCSYVAVFVQFNEINSGSSLSITLDNASLVRTVPS